MRRSIATSGSIPERLKLICKPETQVQRFWDWRSPDRKEESLRVKPAFVSDATNAKTIKTGISWVGNYTWDPVTQKYVTHQPELLERDNTPISGIKIFSLDVRSEGGRAYKVVLPDGIYVDLREDVLLDTMLHAGISPGGVLGGEYVFARVASQMKLVRVGSELHKSLVSVTAKGKMKRLSNDSLVPGHVYETKGGKRRIFLGWITSKEICSENKDYSQALRGKTVFHKKAGLWWETFYLNSKWGVSKRAEIERAWSNALKSEIGHCSTSGFLIKTEHAMIAEVPELTSIVASFLPNDMIETVQRASSDSVARMLKAAGKLADL